MIYYLTHQNLTNRKFIKMSQNLKAASRDSQMLVTATYSQQMTEVISSTSSFDQLNIIEDGSCCIFARENRQLKFHRTPYTNYHFKEQKCFFFCHNNYHCIKKKFRTIFIGTDMLSADRLRQHRMTEK